MRNRIEKAEDVTKKHHKSNIERVRKKYIKAGVRM